jgi:gliding motility-associated-like protein
MKSTLRFLFFLFALPTVAQNISIESNLFIPFGIEMSTNGNVTNTGFFQNNGSFSLKGDWLNQSIYQGTGLIMLAGANQLVANNNQSIEEVSIDGGGIKTIKEKLIINKKINFNDGVILVDDSDTLWMNTNCIAIGGSTNSYVNGALSAQGTGYKFFPVGKNGKYHPVELLEIKGINPTVEIEVEEILPPIQTSSAAIIQQDIYWTRKTLAGTFENSPIALGYNFPPSTLSSRLVIAEGLQFGEEFSLYSNLTFTTTGPITMIGSRKAVTKNIFAVGELPFEPPSAYYLSTTLSPNATNTDNRTIKVFGSNLTPVDFYFQVFNRWGLVVFETQSYTDMAATGWDGRQNGNLLPSGAYPFSIKYIDTAAKSIQQTGFITIIH